MPSRLEFSCLINPHQEVVVAMRARDPAHPRHVGHWGVGGRGLRVGREADHALAVGARARDALKEKNKICLMKEKKRPPLFKRTPPQKVKQR